MLRNDTGTLGSGSMWNGTTTAHDWLRGDGPVELENGQGVTSIGTFASLPTSTGGFVWFVGQVVDVTHHLGDHQVSYDPRPVVGVALTTGDHVWWVRKVASLQL